MNLRQKNRHLQEVRGRKKLERKNSQVCKKRERVVRRQENSSTNSSRMINSINVDNEIWDFGKLHADVNTVTCYYGMKKDWVPTNRRKTIFWYLLQKWQDQFTSI
jgi:hypothetical protein